VKPAVPQHTTSFSSSLHSNSVGEEKRRLEGRLTTLEEDLEEEQMNSEAAVEKARKAEEQVDRMNSELGQQQSHVSKLEKTNSQLDKQVSVLKGWLLKFS